MSSLEIYQQSRFSRSIEIGDSEEGCDKDGELCEFFSPGKPNTCRLLIDGVDSKGKLKSDRKESLQIECPLSSFPFEGRARRLEMGGNWCRSV